MVKILAFSGLALILSRVAFSDENVTSVQKQQQQYQHQSTPRSEDLNEQDQPETILLLEDSGNYFEIKKQQLWSGTIGPCLQRLQCVRPIIELSLRCVGKASTKMFSLRSTGC